VRAVSLGGEADALQEGGDEFAGLACVVLGVLQKKKARREKGDGLHSGGYGETPLGEEKSRLKGIGPGEANSED